jgi:hypothetical protein|tara:strand:+ start:138 stop:362 length:225 start_codon:yes stop_codon:yes gene_type:complete
MATSKKTTKKKAPAKKAAPKAAPILAMPDYAGMARHIICEQGWSNSPAPDAIATLSNYLSAAYRHGELAGRGNG